MTAEEFQELVRKTNAQHDADKRHVGSPEHDLQVSCINWFAIQYNDLWSKGLLWATPNGGKRDKISARRLKEEGARAGVPDLFLAAPRNGYHGLFIEMKNGKKGRLEESQKEMLANLSRQGYSCHVCRNFDQFREIINQYLKI